MTTPTQDIPTKLMLIIVRDEARKALVNGLVEAHFRVTEFSSTGGFLRRGNTTLLIGIPSSRQEEALSLVRSLCASPAGADQHTATIFVLPARQVSEI